LAPGCFVVGIWVEGVEQGVTVRCPDADVPCFQGEPASVMNKKLKTS